MEARIRVLVAKHGPEERDRGTEVIAQARHDTGMEVMDLLLRQTPQIVAIAARQEDVEVNGLATVSGRHIAVIPRSTHLGPNRGMSYVAAAGTISDARWAVACSSSVAHAASPDARVET